MIIRPVSDYLLCRFEQPERAITLLEKTGHQLARIRIEAVGPDCEGIIEPGDYVVLTPESMAIPADPRDDELFLAELDRVAAVVAYEPEDDLPESTLVTTLGGDA